MPEKRKIIDNLKSREDVVTNKNVLIVDDDVRNLFALTTAFEKYGLNTITAESGQGCILITSLKEQVLVYLFVKK